MKYCLAILLALTSLNTYAALHKWVDAQGVVHYSDGQPPPDVQAETLRIRDTRSQDAVPEATDEVAASGVDAPKKPLNIYEREAERKKAQKAKEEAEKKAAKLEEDKRTNAINCERARAELNTMQNSPMVASYNSSGERTILDDAGRQQQIQHAQEAIRQYCK